MSLPPSIGTPPPAPRRPRPSRRGPVFVGALAILAVSATVMWLSGSSDEPTAEGPTETSLTRSSSDTTTSAPTISVPPASTTTGPSVPAKSTPTVEPDPEPAPPKRTRPEDLAPNGDKKGPPRNLPDRTKERVPVRPRVDTSQVAWADAKVVAGNALDVAHTFAVSDGRAPKRLAASVKDLVAPNVAERMVDLFGNGSPTPKGVSQKGQTAVGEPAGRPSDRRPVRHRDHPAHVRRQPHRGDPVSRVRPEPADRHRLRLSADHQRLRHPRRAPWARSSCPPRPPSHRVRTWARSVSPPPTIGAFRCAECAPGREHQRSALAPAPN